MPALARLWIPVILSLLVQVPFAIFVLTPAGAHAMPDLVVEPWRGWAALALAVLGPLSLLLARRFPGPVVAFVSAAAAADVLLGPLEGPPFLALAFALVGAVVRGARLWAWISVGVAWVATLAIAAFIGVELRPAPVAFTTFGILLVMGIAEGIRSRREHYAEFRRAYAQRKVSEVQAERVRIARELHDVLAHSLSQINVQAGVGLHLMESQPAKAAEALASIKETSKTALDEVRSVLGVLRSDDGDAPLVPEPGLDRIAELVASVTSQGLDVSLTNTTCRPAGTSAETRAAGHLPDRAGVAHERAAPLGCDPGGGRPRARGGALPHHGRRQRERLRRRGGRRRGQPRHPGHARAGRAARRHARDRPLAVRRRRDPRAHPDTRGRCGSPA